MASTSCLAEDRITVRTTGAPSSPVKPRPLSQAAGLSHGLAGSCWRRESGKSTLPSSDVLALRAVSRAAQQPRWLRLAEGLRAHDRLKPEREPVGHGVLDGQSLAGIMGLP